MKKSMKRITAIFNYQLALFICILTVTAIFVSACKETEEVGVKQGEGQVVFQISKKNLYSISSLSEVVTIKPVLEFEDKTIVLPSMDLTGNEEVIQSEPYTLKVGHYKVKSYKTADKDGNWIADLELEEDNTFDVKEGSEPVLFNVFEGIRVNLSTIYLKNILLGICNEIWPNDKSKWIWKEEDEWEDWKNLEWEIEEGTGVLLSLTGLNFNRAFYDMETLPEPACNISTLENITIIGDSVTVDGTILKNKFKYLPKKIVHTDVKVLTIINCEFEEIPEFLMDCDLHSLTIVDCNLKSIPESISKMENLRVLSLRGNQITTIPSSITKLKRLESLNLSNNPLESIPTDALEGCTALQDIVFSNTNLSQLPNMPLVSKPEFELGDIIGRGLQLDGCKFTSIPATALACPAIAMINLRNNQLTSVDLTAAQTPNLGTLYLDGNKIASLNIDAPNLISLSLVNTGIQSVPLNVKADRLKVLNLKGNRITSIPENYFSAYPKISQVELSDNLLTQLPSELGFEVENNATKTLNYLGLENMPQLIWKIPSAWTNALLHSGKNTEGTQYPYPFHYVSVEASGSNGVTK